MFKVFGRQTKVPEPPKLFGQQTDDIRISHTIFKSDVKKNLLELENAKTEEILLFVAYIRINTLSLYNPSLRFSKLENCLHPDNIIVKLSKGNGNQSNYLNPLNDEILLKNNTSIDVDIEISLPFTIPNIILNSDKYFRRIIVMIYNKTLAKEVLTNVLLCNQEIFGPNLIIPNYYPHETSNFYNLTNIENIITGFAVDLENFCYMFYEGTLNTKAFFQAAV